MSETVCTLVAEAKKSKYSLIPHLLEDDILIVWDALSGFIEKQMLQVKGVCIQGFGTFTFSQRRIELGGNKHILIQRPVLVMAERLLQTHSLQYPKQHATGQIPVVSLNYTALANGTSFDRDTVEICLREIMLTLGKVLAAGKNVEIDFTGVGRLVLKDKKAKMKFFKHFIHSMDTSGNLKSAFRPGTRPGSEGSIISGPLTSPPRSYTSGSIVLPKIVETSEDDLSLSTSSPPSCPPIPSSSGKKMSPRIAGSAPSNRPETPFHTPRPVSVISAVSLIKPLSTKSNTSNSTCSSEANSSLDRPRTCSHSSSTGQELCYLCHQRAIHNIPISLAEERRERERVQDKLLQEFQHHRDGYQMAKEQAKVFRNKEIEQDTAHFNLETSEIRKLREKEDSLRNMEFYPSYIFQYRSLTPCYTKKQLEYCLQLDEQVRRRSALTKVKNQEESLEKKEQEQLSKELAALEDGFAKKMAENKAHYLQSLNDQVQQKGMKSRSSSPASQPVFGVHDITPNKLQTKRERAKQLYQEQLAIVSDRKQCLKLHLARMKEEDAKLLQRNKQELSEDLKSSRKEKMNARKELEKYWLDTIQDKHAHQFYENQAKEGHGILLQDQCKKYLRCDQCQRRRENKGTSNVLSETRYISGSRLMV